MKSLSSSMELQIGMNKFDPAYQATVTRKTVFTTGRPDEPKIEAWYDPGSCWLRYRVDGVERYLDSLWCAEGSLATGTEDVAYFVSGNDRFFYFPKSGISFHIRKKHSDSMGCYMNIKVCLPDDVIAKEKLVGMFGSPDGSNTNDFMTTSGVDLDAVHNQKTEWGDAYD